MSPEDSSFFERRMPRVRREDSFADATISTCGHHIVETLKITLIFNDIPRYWYKLSPKTLELRPNLTYFSPNYIDFKNLT